MRDIVADLMRDEGYRSTVYRCSAGRATIGFGRNIDDVGVTEEEARHLLDNDIARVEHQLDRSYPWWIKCPETVRRGLLNMTFNLGINRLGEFKKMLACLQAGDYRGAAREALDSKWAEQVGDRAKRIATLFEEAKGD